MVLVWLLVPDVGEGDDPLVAATVEDMNGRRERLNYCNSFHVFCVHYCPVWTCMGYIYIYISIYLYICVCVCGGGGYNYFLFGDSSAMYLPLAKHYA